MKTIKKISTLILFGLLVAGISFAQEKTEKEKKAEAEREAQQLEQQVQSLLKEKKILHEKELQQILESTKKLQETEWKSMIEAQNKYREEALRNFEKQENWKRFGGRDVVVTPPFFDYKPIMEYKPIMPDSYYRMGIYRNFNDANTLNISKELEDVTYSKDFPYEVTANMQILTFSVSGELKGGEMSVIILKPKGGIFQEIQLSPLADVSWSQSLKWKKENSDDFTGSWNIRVKAKRATGKYRVSVRAN